MHSQLIIDPILMLMLWLYYIFIEKISEHIKSLICQSPYQSLATNSPGYMLKTSSIVIFYLFFAIPTIFSSRST